MKVDIEVRKRPDNKIWVDVCANDGLLICREFDRESLMEYFDGLYTLFGDTVKKFTIDMEFNDGR
jgi:hypothetical protein